MSIMDLHGGNIGEVSEEYGLIPEKVVDFSANINPLGLPPAVRKSICRNLNILSHYPDYRCKAFKDTAAGCLGVSPNNILPGNGSVELIYLLPRALKSEKVLIPIPTFSEYEKSARLSGAKCLFLQAKESGNFSVDVEKILKNLHRVDLLFICNPNNPTGFLLEKEKIKFLAKRCKKADVYIVIDEVFMDYVENGDELTMIKESICSSNILILRSLTKFFAMPGLRLGYLVGAGRTIENISGHQVPWSVNSLAQLAGREILKDSSFVERSRRYMFRERKILFRELEKIRGLKPYLPSANFIFCELTGAGLSSSLKLSECCAREGILIRDCSNFRGLDNRYIRVAVRKREENKRLIDTLNSLAR